MFFLAFSYLIFSRISYQNQNFLIPNIDDIQKEINLKYLNSSIFLMVESKFTPASYQYLDYNEALQQNQLILCIKLHSRNNANIFNYFQYFVNIDQEQKSFIHHFKLINQKQQIIQKVEVSNLNYEGYWYTLELKINFQTLSFNITFYQNLNYNSTLYQNVLLGEIQEKNDVFSFCIDDSITAKAYSFYQFQGPVKYNLQPADQKFTPQTQSSCSSTSGSALRSNFSFSSNNYYEYVVSDQISKSYGITTWLKINQNLDQINNFINVIHIQQNPNLQYLTQIGGKLFQISYFISQTKQIAEVLYQSYTFPILPQLINNQDPLEKKIVLDIPLTINIFNWHYLSVQYRNNQLIINLNFVKQNQIVSKTISNVYQFSDLSIVLHFGGTKFNQSNLDGNFINSYFYNCLTLITPKCYFSCQTCFGPYFNQCLTCSNSSNRQLSYDFMCICKIGYLEINQTSCYSISSTLIQETYIPLSDKKEYDQEYPEVICSYGYFKYDDECYACPKLNKIYFCPECIQYPNTWVYNPKCTKNYGQYNQNINNTFTQDIIFKQNLLFLTLDPLDIYFFNNRQLTYCAYCSDYCLQLPCNSQFQLGKYQHLGQFIMITCEEESILLDGECKTCPYYCEQCSYFGKELICVKFIDISTQINNYCLTPSIKCFSCIDNQKYFLNYDHNKCFICQIPNCKFCFQYLLSNPEYNSIFNFGTKTFDQEEFGVGCALCENNFIFNFQSGLCEKKLQQLDSSCKNYYISASNVVTCLTSNSFKKSVQIEDCHLYLSNCLLCINPAVNQYYCQKCDFGYYVDSNYGICNLCSEFNKQYLECFQFPKIYIQYYQNEITPLFYSIAKQYPANQYGYTTKTLYVETCIQGYKQSSNQNCLMIDTIFCSQFDFGCRYCESTPEGTKRLSIINLKCSDCPYYCEYCQQRTAQEIQNINPYVNLNKLVQTSITHRCIQKSSLHENIFFDNQQQVTRICPKNQKCWLKFTQVFYSFNNFIDEFNSIENLKIQYLNLKSVNFFEIIIVFLRDYIAEISLYQIQIIKNSIISQVLSLKETKLTFTTNQEVYCIQFGILKIIDYQEIEFSQLSIQFGPSETSMLIFKSRNFITFKLRNVTITNSFSISDDDKSYNYQLVINNPYYVNLTDVFIQNISINSLFFNLTSQNFNRLSNLVMFNIIFQNCEFENSSILYLNNNLQFESLLFQNIQFKNCTFKHSFFVASESYLFKGKILFENIEISNCTFVNALFIQLPKCEKIVFTHFQISDCEFFDSSMIKIYTSFEISHVQISNNTFRNFAFVTKNKFYYTENSEFYSMKNIIIQDNYYTMFRIFSIQQFSSEKIFINLFDLKQKNLYSLNLEEDKKYFFYQFQSEQISIKNINFLRLPGQKDFEIFNNGIASFENIFIFSDQSQTQIDSSNIFQNSNNQLFYISSKELVMYSIYIYDQFIVDVIIIELNLDQQKISQNITFKNIFVQNLQLFKTTVSSITTFLYCKCSNVQNIEFSYSYYTNIFMQEQIQDTKISSAALLVIYSDVAQVNLSELFITDVEVLNTTNSVFLIQATKLKFNQIHTQGINQKIQSKLQLDFFSQNCYQKSFGGLIYSQIQELIVEDSYFYNINANFGGVFYIVTRKISRIEIRNSNFENISAVNFDFMEGKGGLIFIDPQDSFLNLVMDYVKVYNSSCLESGGLIFIIPQINSTNIFMKNIQIKNIYALYNSFIHSQMINQIITPNSNFYLSNVSIYNQENFDYGQYDKFHISKNISAVMGAFFITNMQIIINNFNFVGFSNEPIFNVNFIYKFLLSKVTLENITFSASQLIFISNNPILQDVLIQNAIEQEKQQQNSSFSIDESESLQTQVYQKNAFLQIQINQNAYSYTIQGLSLKNNYCKSCQLGIIYIQFFSQKIIFQWKFLNIITNYCGQKSCIFFKSTVDSEQLNQVIIKQSYIFSNRAIQTGGLIAENISLAIKDSIFFANKGENRGGAIMFHNNNNNILLSNVVFLQNEADIGGAIYDMNFYDQIDLQKIFFFKNKAVSYGSSLATSPTTLQLVLNREPLKKIQRRVKDLTYEEVIINNKQNKKYLFFPSGTSINEYLKLDKIKNEFFLLDSDLDLQLLNSLQEEMKEKSDQKCFSNSSIYYIDNNNKEILLENSSRIQNINYNNEDNKYSLNNLIFILNPYMKQQFIQVIISCISFEKNNYSLRFKIKTFPCQIGEYLSNDQCIKCNGNEGYYSVQKNSTICKRIDIKKIKSTNGAMIELEVGYWRPALENDEIEFCYNFPLRCKGGSVYSDQSCDLGAIGALCEQCDIYDIHGDGQYLNSNRLYCQQCKDIQTQVYFFVIQSVWIIFMIYLTVRSIEISNKQLIRLKCMYRNFNAFYKTSLNQTNTLIKIANNNIQILSIIETFQIQVIFNISNVILFFGDSNYAISQQIDCSIPFITNINYEYAHFILIILLPFFYFSFCSLLFMILFIGKKISFSKTYSYSTILYLYCLNSKNIIKWGVSLISIRTISQIDWIQANVASKFHTSIHYSWIIKFISPILVIFGILVPLFLYLQLRSIRTKLDLNSAMLKFAYLYNEYTQESYYWEILKMGQKLSIILIINYYEQYIIIKGLIILLIILFYYYLCHIIKPFKLQLMNKVETKTQFILSLVIALSLLLHIIQQHNFNYLNYIIQLIILILVGILVEIVLHQITISLFNKFNLKFDVIRKIIQTRYPWISIRCKVLRKLLQCRQEQIERIHNRYSKIKRFIKFNHQTQQKKNKKLILNGYPKESFFGTQFVGSSNTSRHFMQTDRENHNFLID